MRPCPLCGGTGGAETFPFGARWGGRLFRYFRCEGCGTAFADPAPSDAELESMYSRGSYHERMYSPDPLAAEGSLRAALDAGLAPGSLILDFGCGGGDFIRAALAAGLRPEGAEVSPETREWLKSRLPVPIHDPSVALASKARFDAIRLADVLEHLPRPAELFRSMAGSLRPGGLFLVEGPLQAHPSLVYWTSRLLAGLKRRAGLWQFPETPPTHLLMTNAAAQKRFFTGTLGWECLSFELVETGWPYLSRDPVIGLGGCVRAGIGRAAVVVSRVAPGLANRFRATLRPRA